MGIGHEALGLYYAPDTGGNNGGGDRRAEALRNFLAAPDTYILPYESRPLSDDDRQKLTTLRERLYTRRTEPGFVGVVEPIIARLDRLIGPPIDDLLAGLDGEESTSQPINTAETLRTPEQFDAEMERLWAKVQTNVKPTNVQINQGFVEEIRALIERKPFPSEDKRTHEKEKWDLIFDIWNAYLAGSPTNDSEWKLTWIDADRSRKAVSPGLKIEKMWKFLGFEEVKPIAKFMERCMSERVYFGVNDRGVMLSWDYARDGDPTPDMHDLGIPTLVEWVSKNIENGTIRKADGSTLDNKSSINYATLNMAIIGELRMKHFKNRYASYLASPVDFDPRPVADMSPMAMILYKIRSIGKIPTGYLNVALILRNPQRKGMYVESAVNEHNRDRDNWGGSWPGEFVPRSIPSRDIEIVNGEPDPKADPETALRNDNVKAFVETRGYLAQLETGNDKAFTPVHVPEDLVLTLPPLWDVLMTDQYHNLTYETYYKLADAWHALHEWAEQLEPTVRSLDDIENGVSEFISRVSKYKGIFGTFKKGTERGDNIRLFIRELFLQYLKRLYDSYSNLTVKAEINVAELLATQTTVFLDTVIEAVERATTLESTVSKEILGILKRQRRMYITNGLFSRKQGLPYPLMNPFERRRREKLVAQFTAKETESEKKK